MGKNNRADYCIEVFTASKFPEWDEFIKGSPQYSYFATSHWLKAVSGATGRGFRIVGCYDNGELAGGCVLYVMRLPEGKTAKFPPLTQYSGLLLSVRGSAYLHREESRAHGIMNSIIGYLQKNFDYAVLLNHPALVDIRPFIWGGWDTQVKYTYIMDLKERFYISKDIERRAKAAEDNGIEITEACEAQTFYDLWLKSFKRQNVIPPMERPAFLRLFRALEERGVLRMFIAKAADKTAVASNIYITDKENLFYWLAAFNPAYSGTGANQLLIKYVLENLKEKFSSIDFVGADTPTIARYKATFGGKLTPHYQLSKAISLRAKAVSFMRRAYRGIRKPVP